jgi:hypothetical protein
MSVIAKNSLFAICCIPLLSLTISAQLQVVGIEQPQFAKSVAGVVVDPSGAALPGVTVEERSEDWEKIGSRNNEWELTPRKTIADDYFWAEARSFLTSSKSCSRPAASLFWMRSSLDRTAA